MADLTVTSAVDTFMAAANRAAMLSALNITLGGEFATSGAFTTTLTVTGNTNVTLPTSGTLAILGANTFTGAQVISVGSLTTTSLSISQTWNSAGATCRGFELAVTDTNSAAGSTVFRLLGGAGAATELFKVAKDGQSYCAGNMDFATTKGPTSTAVLRTTAPITQSLSDNYQFFLSNVLLVAEINTNGLVIAEGRNISAGTTTGTKFGMATSQKFAWWTATPVIQPAHIADPSGGAIIDSEARTAINAILAWQATLGLTAAS